MSAIFVACGGSTNDSQSSIQQCDVEYNLDVCTANSFTPLTASSDEGTAPHVVVDVNWEISGPAPGKRGYVIFTPTTSGTFTFYFDQEPIRVCDEAATCSSPLGDCGDFKRFVQYTLNEGEPHVIEMHPTAANQSFLMRIVPPAPPPPPPSGAKLAAPIFYPSTGTLGRHFSVGDLNGDGAAEVVISNPDDAGGDLYVDILANDGNGAFAHVARIQTSAPRETVIADFDGDGDNDIAGIAADGQGPLPNFLLTNEGNFTFTKTTSTPTLQYLGTLSGGDFDEDGITDLVATYGPGDGNSDSEFVIHKMPGFSVLHTQAEFGADTSAAIAGDFNGDGNQDVLVGSRAGSIVRLYLGDGSGAVTFDQELTLSLDPYAPRISKLYAFDLDDNGYTDFFAYGADSEGFGVEHGSVTLSSASGFASQELPFTGGSTAFGDYDHDSRIDLITGVPDASAENQLFFYRSSDDGFVFDSVVADNFANQNLIGADVNNDGLADLLAGTLSGVHVFLGTP